MNKKYHRLCAQDRKVIYNMNKASIGQVEIGKAIGFSQATVSKELSRNRGKRGYRPRQANDLAVGRAKQKQSKSKAVPRSSTEPSKTKLKQGYSVNIALIRSVKNLL